MAADSPCCSLSQFPGSFKTSVVALGISIRMWTSNPRNREEEEQLAYSKAREINLKKTGTPHGRSAPARGSDASRSPQPTFHSKRKRESEDWGDYAGSRQRRRDSEDEGEYFRSHPVSRPRRGSDVEDDEERKLIEEIKDLVKHVYVSKQVPLSVKHETTRKMSKFCNTPISARLSESLRRENERLKEDAERLRREARDARRIRDENERLMDDVESMKREVGDVRRDAEDEYLVSKQRIAGLTKDISRLKDDLAAGAEQQRLKQLLESSEQERGEDRTVNREEQRLRRLEATDPSGTAKGLKSEILQLKATYADVKNKLEVKNTWDANDPYDTRFQQQENRKLKFENAESRKKAETVHIAVKSHEGYLEQQDGDYRQMKEQIETLLAERKMMEQDTASTAAHLKAEQLQLEDENLQFKKKLEAMEYEAKTREQLMVNGRPVKYELDEEHENNIRTLLGMVQESKSGLQINIRDVPDGKLDWIITKKA